MAVFHAKQYDHTMAPVSASTLDGLFHTRAQRSPDKVAYRYFDLLQSEWRSLTWSQMVAKIAHWQAALSREGLQAGERVAIMLKNCPEWVAFDQAALGLGLVTVPLYTSDRPDNAAYVLRDCGARVLLIDSAEHWRSIDAAGVALPDLRRVVTLKTPPEGDDDPRLRGLDAWLPATGGEFRHLYSEPKRLATIIYTSGTTGRPKGVMLSHHNILQNLRGILHSFEVYESDHFLSFLPLSHTFERTAGYYLPVMAGATVTYARSFQQLQEDLILTRPTILMSVPRLYERIHAALRSRLDQGSVHGRWLFELAVEVGLSRFEHQQGRQPWKPSHLLWPLLGRLVADKLSARLGGRIRIAVSGGAALPPETARVFIGLGITILQGYGLTEASPVVSVNRLEDNVPSSVGKPLPGVEVRIGNNGALQVRGDNVMMGYWNNPEATRAILTEDGWLDTGDVVRIDAAGHIFITGRIKEIIVLSNGEKVPPGDLEATILVDPLFEQVMVIGEGRSYLVALAVVNRERWEEATQDHPLPDPWPDVLQNPRARAFALARIERRIHAFPGYAKIRRVALLSEPWTVENGLLTPTLKLKRNQVLARYQQVIEALYADLPS
ncbi:MAG: long-chain fatty acid--CoA ligase [Methylophilaceae bacterium]|nr:long-chain fatty acid--CoA ligase [Methylophilaceae bacterium]